MQKFQNLEKSVKNRSVCDFGSSFLNKFWLMASSVNPIYLELWAWKAQAFLRSSKLGMLYFLTSLDHFLDIYLIKFCQPS